MRIIAGKAGSIPLQVPKSLTRPTTDRVRESIFSSLGERVIDAAVLDLFAGSGSLGIEALSRGAKSATFVDTARDACTIINQNLEKAKLTGGTTRGSDVRSFISSRASGEFDLIFADPPYARDEISAAMVEAVVTSESLCSSLSDSGIMVLETLARAERPDLTLWEVIREKRYGKTKVFFLSAAN
ncbi:16S rRNA (guanine(966)-N(2))-methyltransferase RsmD [Verrucomicrobiales bacterium]|jgi:16S rRNA (guanine966-N2)-methyltransferase|nr:16S rRNA (guanine(966)-N(2))-methyltransferase RsmD [Verrucomicrobiales bacterium]